MVRYVVVMASKIELSSTTALNAVPAFHTRHLALSFAATVSGVAMRWAGGQSPGGPECRGTYPSSKQKNVHVGETINRFADVGV